MAVSSAQPVLRWRGGHVQAGEPSVAAVASGRLIVMCVAGVDADLQSIEAASR